MKKELTKLERIKKVLFEDVKLTEEVQEVQLSEMKLEDGITVIEAEEFEAGKEVFVKTEDGQSIPLVKGEYKLESGMILVVEEEGVIAEIKEATKEEEEAAPEAEEEVAASEAPTEAPVAKKVIESVSKETHFSAEEKEALENEIAELKAQIAELSKVEEETQEEEVELAKAITPNPENKEEVKFTRLAPNKKGGIGSRVLSNINKYN
tara:strand:- start:1498 stop:2121 length:624 start_codon:yes stop_codon:yes gene_type:complete